MEIVEELNSNEKMLALRAAAMHVPLAGTFELTPVCNMNCRMCYIRTAPKAMKSQGYMLTAEEWIEIASEARDKGLLYLLLTGGEPFLYSGFEQLYSWLGKSGIVVMLNTNGTLITKERADLLLKYPPRKVNISLYGASEETYGEVCRCPEGFPKTLHAVRLLKERKIPVKLNSSLTPLNFHDLEGMHRIADQLEVPLQVTPYMFPPVRKNGIDTTGFIRFEPEEAAQMVIENAKISFRSPGLYHEWIKSKLNEYEKYKQNPYMNRKCGFSCFASKNNFWINWKGEMLPCGMLNINGMKVLEQGFTECWEKIGKLGQNIHNPGKCCACDMRPLCNVCAASSMAETGSWDKSPEYLCRMTKAFLQMLKQESTQSQEEI